MCIKAWIQQSPTDSLPDGWCKCVIQVCDALRVGTDVVVDENFEHLDEHRPTEWIAIETWRLHAWWFDDGTTYSRVLISE